MAEVLPDGPRLGGFMRAFGARRSAVIAFVTGVAGTAAFVASLSVDWQRVTLPQDDLMRLSASNEFTVGLDAASYGLAYVVGVLGLLALLGAVFARPEIAARLRTSATGLGIGLAAVLVGIMNEMRDVVAQLYGFGMTFPGDVPVEIQQVIDDTTYATQPGQLLAFGAVVALVAGVWLAAGPIRHGPGAVLSAAPGVMVPGSSTAESTAPVPSGAAPVISAAVPAPAGPVPPGDATVTEPATVAASEPPLGPPGLPPDRSPGGTAWPPARAGYADGLTVTSSDVIDPGTQADILRS